MKSSKSFYDWCIDNHKEEILNRWDYELNNKNPKDIKIGTTEEYYFKCPRGLHKSELAKIRSIVNMGIKLKCKQCNSFAQWGIDNLGDDFLDKYWDYKNNIDIDPWKIQKSTNKLKVYILYQNDIKHRSCPVKPCDFTRKNKIKLNSDFGKQHIDRSKSVGYIYPDILKIWSNKNHKSPYDYTSKSRYKIWVTNNKIEKFVAIGFLVKYKINIDNFDDIDLIIRKQKEKYSQSKLGNKVNQYINEKYGYKLNHEENCSLIPINPKTHRNLPFDNEIKDLKLIIEVNGKQHYFITKLTLLKANREKIDAKDELHKQKLYDRYKRYVSYIYGYEYLSIPWWTETDDSYKRLIDLKIKRILKEQRKPAI